VSQQPSEHRFNSAAEFREVLDRALAVVAEEPEAGGLRRSLDVRQCYRCPDLDVVVQVRPAEGGAFEWVFSEDEDWDAQVELTMDSDVANRYFQGAESAIVAIARGRIKVSSRDYAAALRAFPANSGLIARYTDLVRRDYPHLVVGEVGAARAVPAA